jgi:o-succinylbenzoate synthase
MFQYHIHPRLLDFIIPAGTSRGVMKQKKSWLIELHDTNTKNTGWGECSIIENLSPDFTNEVYYLNQLNKALSDLRENEFDLASLNNMPSIKFGIETAMISLKSSNPFNLFDTPFSNGDEGILINGLIWMGNIDFMQKQIETKLLQGFSCLKLKIGALRFEDELQIIARIRKKFSPEILEIRVDANGAFSYDSTLVKLAQLSKYHIHSIEQPIKAGNWIEMCSLCANTPIPIALDEELIGTSNKEQKKQLLNTIRPQYIILKPSLLGGFESCTTWIELAEKKGIQWWITSALESNLGLNAIAQYASTFPLKIPQGLGTGSLYSNNIPSPLMVVGEKLMYDQHKKWTLVNQL